jgi:hypothetical protein
VVSPTRYTFTPEDHLDLRCCAEVDGDRCDSPAETCLVLDLPAVWVCGPVCPLHLPSVTGGYRTAHGGHARFVVGAVQESLF